MDLLFQLETFLFCKKQKRHHGVSENIQINFLFKVLLQMRRRVDILIAVSEKHLHHSLFVKRIIAIEAQLYFLGLVGL